MRKGQISIEFISLLAIALLASSVLVTELNDRALEYSKASPYSEAQKIAQKTAYSIDYVRSNHNASKTLDFNPDLENDYSIVAASNQVVVSFETGSASFPTSYSGSQISLNSSESYKVSYDGGLSIKS